jgi:hypothetical protein
MHEAKLSGDSVSTTEPTLIRVDFGNTYQFHGVDRTIDLCPEDFTMQTATQVLQKRDVAFRPAMKTKRVKLRPFEPGQ